MINMTEAIYRKMNIGGMVSDAEYRIVINDIHNRLLKMEEQIGKLEEPAPARPRSGRPPKKKVSTD